MKKDTPAFDVEDCTNNITSATQHIHSLGLAHNDLSPWNVMIDSNNNPIIIGFGSCQPFGNQLIATGTPGWMEEDFSPSFWRRAFI
jgi:serine/threonine protein kinase